MSSTSLPTSVRRPVRPRTLLTGLVLAALPVPVLLSACTSAEPQGAAARVGEAEQLLTQCVTFQRGAGGTVSDAMLSFPPGDKNYGSHPLLRTGKKDESLLWFDLGSIPEGAVIDSATLRLYTNGATGDTVSVHAATAAWSESTVTYNSFAQHFEPAAVGMILPSSPNALKTVSLTSLVSDWVTGAKVNHGVLLKGTQNPPTYFWSSDSDKPALRPALEVCFTTPDNHCDPDPCQNGATCVNNPTGYTCDCQPGWTGTDCETNIDECAPENPCLNGAVCTDGVNGYTCACQPGYTGANCESDIDECESSPCLNGACIDQINAYQCECYPGFTGTNCEINIDECAPENPCLNDGTCTDGMNGYTCACATGYTGANCEENIDDCPGNQCQNGSACLDGVASYTCICPPGYTGTYCETDIDECAPENPCLNGGSCTDGVNGYTCGCASGYTGANCEVDINECASNPCLNNGLCVDQVNAYQCQCPSGFTGNNCETPVCGAGFADCDGSAANGCEVNLSSNAAHCGACGNACGAGLICTQGACQAPPSGQTTEPPISSPALHGPRAPAVADIDGDANPDVLVANAESGSASTPSGSLTVHRGVGDGNLQAEEYYTGAPLSSNAVVAADVNGDGWLDAITVDGQTNLATTDGSISVYLNAGASAPGIFGVPTQFSTGAPGSIHLCAADFDGDGKIDIATTSVSTSKVSVMFGDGAGGFAAPQIISILSTGGVQSTIGAADLNGDGRPDLVVTSPGSARLSVLLNQGSGTFAAPVAYANAQGGFSAGIAFGDADGDGVLDVISNGSAGRFLYFFKGQANGTLSTGAGSTVTSTTVADSALGVVVGDYNGDGKLDAYVLRTTTTGGVYPMTGNGAGAFSVGSFVPTGSSPGLNALTTADMNHDGYLDLILTNRGSGSITVILNAL